MGELFLSIHSFVRYLVVVTLLVALLVSLVGLAKRSVTPTTTVGFRIFVAALDVQAAIGILVLITTGFYGRLAGHIVLMLAAIAWAHFANNFAKKRPEDPKLAGLIVVTILGCATLIASAILAIGRPIV